MPEQCKAVKRAATSKESYRKYHSQKQQGDRKNYSNIINLCPPANKRKQPSGKGHLLYNSLQGKINSISYPFHYFKEKDFIFLTQKPALPKQHRGMALCTCRQGTTHPLAELLLPALKSVHHQLFVNTSR